MQVFFPLLAEVYCCAYYEGWLKMSNVKNNYYPPLDLIKQTNKRTNKRIYQVNLLNNSLTEYYFQQSYVFTGLLK